MRGMCVCVLLRIAQVLSQTTQYDPMCIPVQVLQEEIHPLVPGFKDTPFILYLLKSQAKYLNKVYFEQEAGLNRHWLQVAL